MLVTLAWHQSWVMIGDTPQTPRWGSAWLWGAKSTEISPSGGSAPQLQPDPMPVLASCGQTHNGVMRVLVWLSVLMAPPA